MRVPLRILDVGDRRTDNTALLKFEMEDAIALPDQPIHLTADIRNATAATISAAQATLSVDGDSRPVLLPDLPPGSTTHVPLSLILDSPGPHAVSLALSHDALPQDDVRYLSLDVRPTVSVLLVDGLRRRRNSNPRPISWRWPIPSARPWNVERTTQFDPRRLVPGAADVPDVLVLANVPSLSAEQAAAVERLVRRGMGLMIFSGDLVDVDLYNERLYRDGRGLCRRSSIGRSKRRPPASSWRKMPNSPLAPLGKLLPEALARIHVKQYSAVQLDAHGAGRVSILARWNNSENPPAVLQKTLGRGRVLLFTCTAGKKWTDWPLDPTYLLAVRSAALAIARGQESGGSLAAGEPIQVPLDNNQAAIDPKITCATAFGRQESVRKSCRNGPDRETISQRIVAAIRQDVSFRHLHGYVARREIESPLTPLRRESAAERKRFGADFALRS